MPDAAAPTLIAVDIGNSRIKLGRFERGTVGANRPALPEPSAALDLPITDRSGQFDTDRLRPWCAEQAGGGVEWLIASVHRGAAERFVAAVTNLAATVSAKWALRTLTYRDVRMQIGVDHPERVGIDRLLAGLAADQVRRRDRAAVVIDLGTAMTVDLIDVSGAFAGGAILPGIAMSARALAEQTDALPRVGIDSLDRPPPPLGKSTVAAIESGLYWGAIGAIRELIRQYSLRQALSPDVFLTGGASARVAELLAADGAGGADGDSQIKSRIRHVPYLVLAGIALAHQAMPEQ